MAIYREPLEIEIEVVDDASGEGNQATLRVFGRNIVTATGRNRSDAQMAVKEKFAHALAKAVN